jgi:hypothetical protein
MGRNFNYRAERMPATMYRNREMIDNFPKKGNVTIDDHFVTPVGYKVGPNLRICHK